MSKRMNDLEKEAILLMVEETATELNAHDVDFFEEYKQSVNETNSVPTSDTKTSQYTSPFIITDVLLGIGLVVLGQTAAAFFEWVCHKTLDHSRDRLIDWLASRRASQENEDEKLEEIVNEAAEDISPTLSLPKDINQEELKKILSIMMTALQKDPELLSKISKQ